VDLFLALPPGADRLLHRSAKAYHASPSQIISLVIETCEDLLRHMLPAALRDYMLAAGSVKTHPSPTEGADELARDLLAGIRERENHKVPVVRVRRHFLVSRETKGLLKMIAAYHSLNVTRIVENLIILGLSDPVIKPKRNGKARPP
jgi:hypothetical protein